MALYTPAYQPTGEEIAVIKTSKGTIRVQLARLTRGDRVRCILQALLVRLKRALIILLRVGASGLLE